MIDQSLRDLVKVQLEQGLARETVRRSLIAQGFSEADVMELLASLPDRQAGIPEKIAAPLLPITAPVQLPTIRPAPSVPAAASNAFQPAPAVPPPIPPHSPAAPAQSPPSPPVVPPPPLPMVGNTPENGKRRVAMIFGVGLAVLVLAGGGYAAYRWFASPTPEMVLAKSFEAAQNIRSLAYEGEVRFNFTSPIAIPDGSATSSAAKVVKFSFSGALETTGPMAARRWHASGELIDPEMPPIAVEFRGVSGVAYASLVRGPEMLEQILGKWVSWTQSDVAPLASALPAGIASDLGALAGATGSPEVAFATIRDKIINSKLFSVAQVLPRESVGGVDSHHYQLAVNPAGVEQLGVDVATLVGGVPLTAEESAEFKFSTTTIAGIAKVRLEVWIDTATYLPRQVLLEMPEVAGVKSNFMMRIATVSFNEPVVVSVPEGAASVQELISPLLGGFTDEMASSAPMGGVGDVDNDGLSDSQEILYGTDSKNPDTDGDGYTDGDEVKNGYNPLGPGKSTGASLTGTSPSDPFPDKLSSCEKYKTTFIHPLTGDTLQREILGIVDGKCDYVEQMPNGGKEECKFTESVRIAAAKYYKDVAVSGSFGVDMSADLSTGEHATTSTINDKVVSNPFQTALESGMCVISGY